jgi:hypothetical protein
MAVTYEWDVELIDVHPGGEDDVIDHFHQASYAGCMKQAAEPLDGGEHWAIVLVCDDDKGRAWAYLTDGKLPTHFEDALGGATRNVPQRFHDEVARAKP